MEIQVFKTDIQKLIRSLKFKGIFFKGLIPIWS